MWLAYLMTQCVLILLIVSNCHRDALVRADDSGDTGAEGKDLLQGRHLMTQLKDELRNETGITK